MRHAAAIVFVLALGCERQQPAITTQPPSIARGGLDTAVNPPLPELEPHEPYRVGGEVKAPTVLHKVEPDWTGVRPRLTIFEAVVTKEGTVASIRAIKGEDEEATRRVLAALKQWRFKPGTRNGVPVDVLFNLTVSPHYR